MSPALCQIVIFGASGDLAAKKLVPGLVGNAHDRSLPGPVQVFGVSRSELTDVAWREELEPHVPAAQRSAWEELAPRISYVAADGTDAADVRRLGERLDAAAAQEGIAPDKVGRLFYLALAPRLFGPVVRCLTAEGQLECEPGACEGWRRVVVEKPFGHDLESARALNRELLEHLREEQLLRIDHYLGKETVQNILTLRFQNAIFEPLWNRNHVESVEITVAETVGVEGGRAAYYDGAGALRDMVQNHVLQVLALVGMEPPATLAADDVRDQKLALLRALVPYSTAGVARDVVRARYVAANGHAGYLDEPGVPAGSDTETYVALRASVRNWRWNGVPFLLRTGKRMAKQHTEVVLRFRTPPLDLLGGPLDGDDYCALRPNNLRIEIQPREGIRLGFLVKKPGPGSEMLPSELGFDYEDLPGGTEIAPAYQRLLLDALNGHATLFLRGDEVEAAWRFADSVRAGWATEGAPPLLEYPAGSMGPKAADGLFRGCEGVWGSCGS